LRFDRRGVSLDLERLPHDVPAVFVFNVDFLILPQRMFY